MWHILRTGCDGRLPNDYPNVFNLLDRLATLAAPLHRAQFDVAILDAAVAAHDTEAITNARKIPHKKIAHHARELVKLLRESNGKHLYYFAADALIEVPTLTIIIERLARGARKAADAAKTPRLGRFADSERHSFVYKLLTCAAQAGGGLTLDRRKEGGSLFEAIELLRPVLPKEIVGKLSFSTQRRIYEAWLKNNKNSRKKQAFERTGVKLK